MFVLYLQRLQERDQVRRHLKIQVESMYNHGTFLCHIAVKNVKDLSQS